MSVFKKISHGGQSSQGRVVVWGVLGWLCLFNVSAWGQFSGGSGTKVDPYLIATANDLQPIGLNPGYWGSHFKLISDLDMTGVAMTPIGYFSGTFDGNGHIIANLTIDLPATSRVGLFGEVQNVVDPNTIFNLGLMNPDITGKSTVGALVGLLWDGTISGCYADGGNVNGNRSVGGLLGHNLDGTISNCSATGQITGSVFVGGLVGSSASAIKNCSATGQITGSGFVGGLVGSNRSSGTLSNCTASGTVEGSEYIGGLVGKNRGGTINNCTATGTVSGNEVGFSRYYVGGLVGSSSGTISDCTATGVVTGTDLFVGGLVGDNSGEIHESHSMGQVTSQEGYLGGLVGSNSGLISKCSSTGDVVELRLIEQHTGGLVGMNNGGTISDCHATGFVDGGRNSGGLVGSNAKGIDRNANISNCYATGGVSGATQVGGLVGYNDRFAKISKCYATGAVTGLGSLVGGLVGNSESGTIRNCYATGAVTGLGFAVGGLVGNSESGRINNCYARGLVNDGIAGANVGGLVGSSNRVAADSYWATDSSGQASSAGGIGKLLFEMKQGTTFAGWGCEAVWTIDEGNDTPRLVWENAPGVLITKSTYSGGTGDLNTPYQIGSAQDLVDLSQTNCEWDKHFKLTADLDLTGVDMMPIGENFFTPFSGTFDGNGFALANLTIDLPTTDFVGLFGVMDSAGAEIRNLGLINLDITGNVLVGGLVGWLTNGTISGCYADGGNVNGNLRVGGLVGFNDNGTIRNCTSTGPVSGTSDVGGLVGKNEYGTLSNCTVSGAVTGTGDNVGGLLGSSRGLISICTATGAVTGTGDNVGGLVGVNFDSTVRNCYATGAVSGGKFVGGMVGINYFDGTIRNCYATGPVSGTSDIGGLVGRNNSGIIEDSFWDTQTSGKLGSAGGTGKTTAQMQMASTFLSVGWDFVGESINGTEDIWTICGGSDYPRFVWQIVAMEDLVCPEHMRVWFTPQRFNPMSQGKWIKGHVIMPEGIEPADIDPAVMVRLAPWGILSDEVEVMMDESGRVELAIAFNRVEVLDALEAEAENHSVGITLIGAFADGSSFYTTRTISILKSRARQLNNIASHWLSGDCRARDWCGGADVNQDGVVNYLDFFLEPMDFIYIFAND